MALHPDLPSSPYEIAAPEQRWFAAYEALRASAYDKRAKLCVADQQFARTSGDASTAGREPQILPA